MGLSVIVGYLADQIANDEEGAEWFRESLDNLNEFLPTVELKAHQEPEICPIYYCDMYGYSGLHYLRRVAAHLDLRGKLPEPGSRDVDNQDPAQDEVLAEYMERFVADYEKELAVEVARARQFDHLIVHSDAEGYYIPQNIDHVLVAPDELELSGFIGSSNALRDECVKLASALELPLDIDPEAEEVWQAAESQGIGFVKWQRYGIESYCCLRLYRAATHSLETGAAIVFC